jgi:hypothetical protein
MIRLRRSAALAALALAWLAGCAEAPPVLNPDPRPATPPPAVLPAQTGRILTQLADELGEPGAQVAPVSPARITGAALRMRNAEFAMLAADETATPDVLSTQFAGTIVSATEAWPRSFIAVTEPEDGGAQYMYLLTQADARSAYVMTAWTRLVAPVTLPTTAPPEVGSPVLAADATGLTISPSEALEAYARAKTAPSGQDARRFGGDPDPARQAWSQLVATWAEALEQLDPKVGQTAEVVPASAFVIGTADGGAIVFGQISSALNLSIAEAKDGQSFSLPPRWAALGDAAEPVTANATIEFLQTVALAIPPEGSAEPITVLGVSEVPVAVAAE